MHPEDIAAGLTDDPDIVAQQDDSDPRWNAETIFSKIGHDQEAYDHFRMYISDAIANLADQLKEDIILPEFAQKYGIDIASVDITALAEYMMNLPL